MPYILSGLFGAALILTVAGIITPYQIAIGVIILLTLLSVELARELVNWRNER
ncbi:hypothetical protein [Salinicoccus albus]|uniref:hypothetical protein n=1 Tax=Salinicoccus albus TaxID=418756 RepID=UPI00036B2B4A|nr:hypothetical protein [Salinicoccus albus]